VPVPSGQPLSDDEKAFLIGFGITFIKCRGTGGYASVWECKASRLVRDRNGNYTDTIIACKVMSIERFRRGDRPVPKVVGRMLSEGDVHHRLIHPNIVSCDAVYYVSQPDTGLPFMRCLLFMELCDGDLQDQLYERQGLLLGERESHLWFVQIADGLKYLHDRHIVHFDIKLKNIMVKNTGQGVVYKLADFGFGRQYMEGEEVSAQTGQGTVDTTRQKCGK
jgi:serine/threonine protein kinase